MNRLGLRLIWCFLLFVQVFQTRARSLTDGHFTLHGKLIGNYTGWIYLVTYNDENKRSKDSCKVTNGKFIFKGIVNGFSDKVYLKLDGEMRLNNDSVNSVNIALDNNEIFITLVINQFSKFKMSGCYSCDELASYEKKTSLLKRKISQLTKQKENNSDLNRVRIIEKNIDSYNERVKLMDLDYCTTHTNSNISSYLLFWLHNSIGETEYLKYRRYFNSLAAFQQQNFYGIKIKQKIKEYMKIIDQFGEKAPMFSGIDLYNQKISLDSLYRSNYVLLDFWASWCKPCREENKHLRNLYAKYHSNGLEIISISSDSDKERWKSAIQSDSIGIWKHTLLKLTTIKQEETLSGVNDEYYVQTLPTKILIDPNGRIVGRFDYSNAETLEKKLVNVFKF